MVIKIDKKDWKGIEAAGIKHHGVDDDRRYSDEVTIDSHLVSSEFLLKLYDYVNATPERQRSMNGVLQKLSMVKRTIENPTGVVVSSLNMLADCFMRMMAEKAPRRWLFKMDTGNAYLVTGAKFYERDRETPAYTRVSLEYFSEGQIKSTSISWSDYELTSEKPKRQKRSDDDEDDDFEDEEEEAPKKPVKRTYGGKSSQQLTGRTKDKDILTLIAAKGFCLETPELIERYERRTADWEEKYAAHFKQFIYVTSQLSLEPPKKDWNGRYREEEYAEESGEYVATDTVDSNGVSNFRVVNDVPAAKLNTVNLRKEVPSPESADPGATVIRSIPVHPLVYVFNLETHTHMWVEASRMTAYQYDAKLVDKLIIADDYKRLIRIMTENPDTLAADFVAGKSGGTVILAIGPPGVGKSMSAEAYAESSEKILYRVQSDQLGITPEEIEKHLKTVFARAERWEAILLVDEADLYLRERGTDLTQNAIVGTLLRTLEWFNGVIFCTSNLEVIDDAILSRCSAVIRYDYPTPEDAVTIYNNFLELFQMSGKKLGKKGLEDFLNYYRLSGRSIKNLLRLAHRLGVKDPSEEDLERVMSFLPSPETTGKKRRGRKSAST